MIASNLKLTDCIYNNVITVSADEEIKSIVPVIKLMSRKLDIPISVDTYKSDVARCALESGASFINDIWGLTNDAGMIDGLLQYECPVIVMHNQDNTIYKNLIKDIKLNSLHKGITTTKLYCLVL